MSDAADSTGNEDALDHERVDGEYWFSRTPAERMEHLEYLRRKEYGEAALGRMTKVIEFVTTDWPR